MILDNDNPTDPTVNDYVESYSDFQWLTNRWRDIVLMDKMHMLVTCPLMSKVPLCQGVSNFYLLFVKASPSSKKSEMKASFVGCIWRSLRIRKAFTWYCDVIGLQLWPLKDSDPELRHSKGYHYNDLSSAACHGWPFTCRTSRMTFLLPPT